MNAVKPKKRFFFAAKTFSPSVKLSTGSLFAPASRPTTERYICNASDEIGKSSPNETDETPTPGHGRRRRHASPILRKTCPKRRSVFRYTPLVTFWCWDNRTASALHSVTFHLKINGNVTNTRCYSASVLGLSRTKVDKAAYCPRN